MLQNDMRKPIVLTVVTATRNAMSCGRIDSLERCISSVAMLKMPHEHLIYDGASTDGTVSRLKKLQGKISGLKVVSEPDTGIYNALNKGVRGAHGNFFYVLGDDDYIIDPKAIDEAVVQMDREGAGMSVSPVLQSDGKIHFRSIREFRCVLTMMPYSHQGVLMRTDLINKLGGFDESFRIVSDYKLCLSAHLADAKMVVYLKPFTYYNTSGLSSDHCKLASENANVVGAILGLTEDEKIKFCKRRRIPAMKAIPFLFHRNFVIRAGAKHAILRAISDMLGMLDAEGNPRRPFRRF